MSAVAKPRVDCEIVTDADAVLHEPDRHPLRQLVARDAVADWLRVLLHIRQRQLFERSCGRTEEREGAEDRLARLASRSTGRVMNGRTSLPSLQKSNFRLLTVLRSRNMHNHAPTVLAYILIIVLSLPTLDVL